MGELVWSAAGGAIGGFFGSLIFLFIRWCISRKKKYIASYYIANEINNGQKNECRGYIMHQYGKRYSPSAGEEKETIKELESSGFKLPVWEWTNDKVGDGSPHFCLFYGPYTSDLNIPGTYLISFYIKGVNFKDKKNDDKILFELDVLETLNGTNNTSSSNIIGCKYIRASDLAKDKLKYSIVVYSNGKNVWQYRATPYNGENNTASNLLDYVKCRIFFEKIEIERYRNSKLL